MGGKGMARGRPARDLSLETAGREVTFEAGCSRLLHAARDGAVPTRGRGVAPWTAEGRGDAPPRGRDRRGWRDFGMQDSDPDSVPVPADSTDARGALAPDQALGWREPGACTTRPVPVPQDPIVQLGEEGGRCHHSRSLQN